MRYMMVFNDDEIRGNGDEPTLSEVSDDAYELMRSGYYHVESVWELPDAEDD